MQNQIVPVTVQSQTERGLAAQIVREDMTVDSRTIAEHCQVQHKNALDLLQTHKTNIESELGLIAFETRIGEKRGVPVRFALLTEDQAIALITMFRNTSPVIKFKIALARAFGELKRSLIPTNRIASMSKLEWIEEALKSERRAVESEAQVLQLVAKTEEDAPKVEFHDTVAVTDNTQSIGEVAKALGTGQGRLFRFLRERKVLMQDNAPYQEHVNAKRLKVVASLYENYQGKKQLYTQTRVTGKGFVYIQQLVRLHFESHMERAA